jgi:hypothetical protein
MYYYSAKCSHGIHEFKYKRSHKKHNHEAGKVFSTDAKNRAVMDLAAAGVARLTPDDIRLSGYRDGENDPGDTFTEI